SLSASSAGEFIQTSISSRAVRTTGIAFGWIAPTSLFGSVVRNAKISFVVSPSLTVRTEVQRVQMPAKKAKGRVSSKANQTGGCVPSGSISFSEKLVKGMTQRFSIPSQRRQCGDLTLRTLVTPGSAFLPSSARRRGHAPPRHHQLATVGLVSDNRGGVVREDPVQRWQIACPVAQGAGQFADCLLALRHRIEIAQRLVLLIATCRACGRRHRRARLRLPAVQPVPAPPSAMPSAQKGRAVHRE